MLTLLTPMFAHFIFYLLTPWVPAALVMQGVVDVGRMDCSSLAAHSVNIHHLVDTLCLSYFKTNYNVVPYGDQSTERVKYEHKHMLNVAAF